MASVLNTRFALRKLMKNETYHDTDIPVPKDQISPESEPELRGALANISREIVADPDSILRDTYTDKERQKDWESLRKKVVLKDGDVLPIDTRSRPGHKLLDHWMPHFYDVKNYKGISVRSLVTQEHVEKALLTNLQMHSTPYKSEIRRMLVMTGGLGSVTKYRSVTSKAVVQYFGARRVLDPCVGWGGRMIGSLSAGAAYVGCEPDPHTAQGLRNILNDIKQPATILEQPAETALDQLRSLEPFDMVLTSPPYFNLELYTAGEQSTLAYPTWDEWVDRWLRVVVLGCLRCIKPGGTSCWSVKNFKTDKKYPLADATKKIHADAGWMLVKTVTMTGSARMGGARIKDGAETRQSEEETFCFQRQSSC